jgi:hypothetical protein
MDPLPTCSPGRRSRAVLMVLAVVGGALVSCVSPQARAEGRVEASIDEGVPSATPIGPSPTDTTIGDPAPVGEKPVVDRVLPDGPTGEIPNASLEPRLVLLGTWTIEYVAGPPNGNGANIQIPLRHLDGLVLKPGAMFDFWAAVGEVSSKAGYRRGGIIVGHHIDPDGALAGGICLVSTTIFNAAARAGLEILSRSSHSAYLSRYPLGLDAAVSKGDGWAETLTFRNDTRESIVIRTVSALGVARVDLYSAKALGRRVSFGEPEISRRVQGRDRLVRTSSLPSGTSRRVEESSDGMRVVVDRLVRDRDGHVLHHDRWVSNYGRLDGLVLLGTG